jgi:hypothetical protein
MKATTGYDLSCVVHVHSRYSDGTATVPEIVTAAREAGRDAVLLTDHDTLAAKHDGWEGWHDGVLLLVGLEVSPRGGHYLAFGLDEEVDHDPVPEDEIPAAVASAGGFGVAAHPFSQGSAMSKVLGPPHPWRRLHDPALTGIEVWSLATDSAEAWRTPLEAIRFLRDPETQLAHPPRGNLHAWDALLAHRRTVAIGGLDAHQKGIRIRGRVRTPMPNREWFRMLGTHLLLDSQPTGEPEADRDLAYAALRGGRCYVSRDSLADARGFDFWAESDRDRREMGDEVHGRHWTIRVRLPRAAGIRLIRDGEVVGHVEGDSLATPAASPGAYRVEAWLYSRGAWRTWILSNAIHVHGTTESATGE